MGSRTPRDDRVFHDAIGFETTKATCGGPSMREDSRRITSNRAHTLGSIAVIAVLVCVSATGGTAAKVKAIKVNPITVDGNITDWAGVPTFYLQEGPRVTAIAHDERFLYVHFRFSDAKLARQLLMTGAIVWVNGDGKHEGRLRCALPWQRSYRGDAGAEPRARRWAARPASRHGTPLWPSGLCWRGAQGVSEVKQRVGPSPARRLGGPTPRRSERGGSVRRAAGRPRRGERHDRRRVLLRVFASRSRESVCRHSRAAANHKRRSRWASRWSASSRPRRRPCGSRCAPKVVLREGDPAEAEPEGLAVGSADPAVVGSEAPAAVPRAALQAALRPCGLPRSSGWTSSCSTRSRRPRVGSFPMWMSTGGADDRHAVAVPVLHVRPADIDPLGGRCPLRSS